MRTFVDLKDPRKRKAHNKGKILKQCKRCGFNLGYYLKDEKPKECDCERAVKK